MEPIFFPNTETLRRWYEENHLKASELLVGFYKTGTKKETITWSQSVDEALCFGWIDSIRWVLSARQEATQQKRLGELISSCEAGDWIKAMRWGKKKGPGTGD